MASPAPSSWPGRLHAELAHAALQAAEPVAQLALAIAEAAALALLVAVLALARLAGLAALLALR